MASIGCLLDCRASTYLHVELAKRRRYRCPGQHDSPVATHRCMARPQKYQSHEIVALLEELGLDFGACSNAYTSADETVGRARRRTGAHAPARQRANLLACRACEAARAG